jgi:hypothetical protein
MAFRGDGWTYERENYLAVSANPEDSVQLAFIGTRIDVVLAEDSGPAAVEIDGRNPSGMGLLQPTRFCSQNHFSTLQRVYWGDNIVPEIWTLTFTDILMNEEKTKVLDYSYRVEGSVTGSDGNGDAKSVFRSNSARMTIDPADIVLTYDQCSKQFIKPGLEIHWIVENAGCDRIAPGDSRWQTAANGLPWGRHVVTLHPVAGQARLRLEAFEAHRPMLADGDVSMRTLDVHCACRNS